MPPPAPGPGVTVATLLLLLLQVPPAIVLLNVVGIPLQNVVVPDIIPGDGVTVTVIAGDAQPVE